jgi:hypothetical protein
MTFNTIGRRKLFATRPDVVRRETPHLRDCDNCVPMQASGVQSPRCSQGGARRAIARRAPSSGLTAPPIAAEVQHGGRS